MGASKKSTATESQYVVKAIVDKDGKSIEQALAPTDLDRARIQAQNALSSGKFLDVFIESTEGDRVEFNPAPVNSPKLALPTAKKKTVAKKDTKKKAAAKKKADTKGDTPSVTTEEVVEPSKAESARQRAKDAKAKKAKAAGKSKKKDGPPSATKVIEACLISAPKNGIDPNVIAANLQAHKCGKTGVAYVLGHVRSLNVGNRKTYGKVKVELKSLKNGGTRLILTEAGNLPAAKVDIDLKLSPAEVVEADKKRVDKAMKRASA